MMPVDAGSAQPLSAEESLVDTGATATAGGSDAVEALCAALVRARPDVKIELAKGDRPYFRFGSGQWGRALYRVTLYTDAWSLLVYALDSPGVPVLTGMRELHALNAILNCSNGHCIIAGNMTKLKQNSKLHLIINLVTDLPQSSSPAATTTATTTTATTSLRDRVSQMQKVMFCGVLDLHEEFDYGEFVMTADRHDAQHLSVSREQLDVLVGDSFCGSGQQRLSASASTSAELVHWLNGADSVHSGDDPRGGRRSSSSGAREGPQRRRFTTTPGL